MDRTVDDMAELRAEIGRLRDVLAIQELKAAYCAACDDDHDGEGVARLFMPDGQWVAVGRYSFDGREEIAREFDKIRRAGKLRATSHMVSNPRIQIEGDRATGRWRLLMLYRAPDDAGGRCYGRIVGHYEDDFVRTPEGWRFETLRSNALASDFYVVQRAE